VALYEIVVYGELAGQLLVNRFHYVSNEATGAHAGAEGLAEAFGLSIDQVPPVVGTPLGDWAGVVSNQVAFDEFIVRDMYSNTNFLAAPFLPSLAGSATGEVEAPFIAFGFSTNRVRTDVRRGQKRFAGVSQNLLDPGGLLTSVAVSALEVLAESLGAVLNWTSGETSIDYTPAVLGLEKHEADPPDHPVPYYTYYETEAEQLARAATGLIWTPKL